ncbi:SGNH hydrolase-type esterase domain-containing protein [Aspergillus spectabilis]
MLDLFSCMFVPEQVFHPADGKTLLPAAPQKRALPPAFFLAGDSTTGSGGGWGDAVVSSLTGGSTRENLGDSGATTGSFRNEGFWGEVLAAVESHKHEYTPYVTIQFGHNNQKTEAGLAAVVDSLSDGMLRQHLENVRELTIQAAETGALWANLNEASREYVIAIGESNSHTYNLSDGDNMHINKEGGIIFAGIVALLLKGLNAEFDEFIIVTPELVAALEGGEYYFPEL